MNQLIKFFTALMIICFGVYKSEAQSTQGHRENTINADIVIELGQSEDAGMSPALLDSAVTLFKRAIDENKVTGVQLLVARRGKVVLQEALGLRDLENNLPMEKNTLIRMASNTKTLVATGILILVEKGLLRINDPVSKYLQGFDTGLSAKISIKHLLTHTAGFANQFDNYAGAITYSSNANLKAPSLVMEAFKIGIKGPRIQPGTSYLYSNWGYTVLGALIESVSCQSIDTFLSENIYEPLFMNNTSHHLYGVDSSRVSMNYVKSGNQWKIIPPETPPFVRSTGGLVTTTWDFAVFCQMCINGGIYNGRRIFSQETVKEATSGLVKASYIYITPQETKRLGLNPDWYNSRDSRELGVDIAYGYGWVVSRNGMFSHAGFRGTFAIVDPQKDLIILIFSQSREGGTPGNEFIEMVQKAIID